MKTDGCMSAGGGCRERCGTRKDNEFMRIRTEIDSRYTELEVHVCSNEPGARVTELVEELHALLDAPLPGTDERGDRCAIRPADILSFYAEGQRVIACGREGRYIVSRKLYELEEQLDSSCFVRISRSEIINYKRIKKLDLSVTGTIRVTMDNGYETYASRRNVAKIKKLLVREKRL